MKIQSVRIKNFRTLKDVTIPFDSVTTFIGPNGTGKSTVLRALDWYFNGKPGSLTENDFSFGVTDEDIEVQVTFADLTEKDRNELGKYAPAGVTTFTAWKRRAQDGSESLSANSKSYAPFNAIREKGSAADKKAAYNELRNSDSSLGLSAWSNVDAANQAMTTWEAAHTDQLVESPESLQTNFFGFNSGGKMSGLFDYVLVTADLRASEESLDGKSSIIGRILERSVDRAAADEEIAKIVEESRVKQQKVYEEKFKEQLETMTAQLNEVVTSYPRRMRGALARRDSLAPNRSLLGRPQCATPRGRPQPSHQTRRRGCPSTFCLARTARQKARGSLSRLLACRILPFLLPRLQCLSLSLTASRRHQARPAAVCPRH